MHNHHLPYQRLDMDARSENRSNTNFLSINPHGLCLQQDLTCNAEWLQISNSGMEHLQELVWLCCLQFPYMKCIWLSNSVLMDNSEKVWTVSFYLLHIRILKHELEICLCVWVFPHVSEPHRKINNWRESCTFPREWHSSGVCLTAPSPQSPVFANPNPNVLLLMALFGVPDWCCIELWACLFVCFLQEFPCKLARVNGELNHSQTWLSNSPNRKKKKTFRANWLLHKLTPGITQSDIWGVVAIEERSY